ncbi:hypothetical protein Pmani_002380 [Petrolisthes manimaculis]|uniref:Uncharacterized protein n=1 Tax=Petrolisthes manimaculis TaxID=1843537 RepID=A0AAE1QI32_9EUCA|nr:hypothetical protein Pmani_002380 [Petrolisthes manimaculis]
MSKSFRLANVEQTSPSTSLHFTTTNWKLWLICQEDKTETLTLVIFSKLGELPGSFHLERLDDGHGWTRSANLNTGAVSSSCLVSSM